MIPARACACSLLVFALTVAGCSESTGEITCPPPPPPVELGTFPYHPVVYHLDLSILAYQVHGQSLVWPFDPYYEERAETFGTAREDFMDDVHDWATFVEGPAQVTTRDGLDVFRGPGALVGYLSNPEHDPVLYNYERVHPWASCVMNADGQWTEYLTPREITAQIADASVAYRYLPAAGPEEIRITPLPGGRPADRDPGAADRLYAFEGGTGDRDLPLEPHSQSLLGVVLLRRTGGGSYDVHIAFRGSRSGKATRAFFDAISADDPAGNPDWITDLGTTLLAEPAVSTIGRVFQGFALSTTYTLPVVFAVLDDIATTEGVPPTNIYVTGHSLGGALAQHFTSAVLLGDQYGPGGAGPAMPAALSAWPWTNLKLITYGAPRAGDANWAQALTVTSLDSTFSSGLTDDLAFPSTDPSIAPRLLDASRPAGFRILISTDPITAPAVLGSEHVGKTVYVNKGCFALIGPPDPAAHEPELIRETILAATGDPRTPPVAWRYLDMEVLNPLRDEDDKGDPVEFLKLRDAVRSYYTDRGLWFDETGFLDDFNLMRSLEGLPPAPP